jgi:predicted pyridoxine 5'-phosphate oxidase superfamily flavin-nucleotide-binding protein
MAPLPGWPHAASPFHTGEQEAQERAGTRERIEATGRRVIRDFLPEQHRAFFPLLPFLAIGSRGADGKVWASILAGAPGFATSPDPRTLRVDALPSPADPLANNLTEGANLGILGIELPTRRRNRVNGTVAALDAEGFTLAVEQSFGNCPQYIQARDSEPAAAASPQDGPPAVERPALGTAETALIAAADTFFIASAYSGAPEAAHHGLDASHRGGHPGFVRIDDARHLTFPDFGGNRYFNTIGNLLVEPRCGLVFIDFATGTTVQLAARAAVVWDGPELASFAGAERLVRLTVERVVTRERALPLRWTFREYSPFLEKTGRWPRLSRAKERSSEVAE